MIIDNLKELQQIKDKCIFLFSGGLDSSFFLLWAKKNKLDVTPLYVHLGPGKCPNKESFEIIQKLNLPLVIADLTKELVYNFISKGIKATTYYQELFPVCSTFSRPLIAQKAVTLAKEINATCVIHSAGFHQNSCGRFNLSIKNLAPTISIGTPFLKDYIPREEKLNELKKANINKKNKGIYSIDENIWGRVIENGELDNLAFPIPERIFSWTKFDSNTQGNTNISLEFKSGLPISINGKSESLINIISYLNEIGGRFQIGRFNNVEDTFLTLKNHEVREAPAAAILHSAKKHLEQAIFSHEEFRLKKYIDNEWINLAVRGHWFSPLKISLDLFMDSISSKIEGTVSVRLSRGSAFVSAIDSKKSLDFNSHLDKIQESFNKISYKELFEVTNCYI